MVDLVGVEMEAMEDMVVVVGEAAETMEMEEGGEGPQGVGPAADTGLGLHLAHLCPLPLLLIILTPTTTTAVTAVHHDDIDTEVRVG